jgi:hypothetical protein
VLWLTVRRALSMEKERLAHEQYYTC